MTSTNQSDFDRVLAEWLDEGPHRAPDRPVSLAIEHARSHPRRPDPFAFLRAGAMSGRPRYAALRPALMLLVLGLLVAAVAAFWVGSSRPSDPVVVPPIATPTPVVSPPSSEPLPRTFQFVDEIGDTVTITYLDRSGLVVGVTGGQPAPDIDIPMGGVGVANGTRGVGVADATALRLSWGGCPNENAYTVLIGPTARDIAIQTVGCRADRPGSRTLTFTFSEPVPADEVSATLLTFGVDLVVAAGNPLSVDVIDYSGLLVDVASGTPGDGASLPEGVVEVTNDPADPRILRLLWTGSPCDRTGTVTIDQTARSIRVARPPCSGDAIGLDRILVLTFSEPVPADEVTSGP